MATQRIRLCLTDLFHQDVMEMIERETRQFSVWEVMDPDDPLFATAYQMLWDAFGPQGEMEREAAIRQFMRDDSTDPTASGSFIRYFLLAAKDAEGNLRGVRDGTVMVNPAYANDLCVVYLSHIYMLPEARGTVLSYWLRIAPVEIAMQYLADLHARGRINLPLPQSPSRFYGMKMDLTAEMEYFDPTDRLSWQRILFYGRGGFDVINPRHFPYLQPDFRDPEEIRATGNQPVPFMVLVRRMGRERQATMPVEEATALMRLLYDDFACHCTPENLEGSLQHVLDHLEQRARRSDTVELLPLPTGSKDLRRVSRLHRYGVYKRSYRGVSPIVDRYLAGPARAQRERGYLDAALAAIASDLDHRPKYVYWSREREVPMPEEVSEP